MDGLKGTLATVNGRLNDIEKKREIVLSSSRRIVRLSKGVIHSIHLGESCEEPKAEMEIRMAELVKEIGTEEWMLQSGPAADCMMEYAEAEILYSIMNGESIPSFDDLGITPQSWLMGLADDIGELRRITVKDLMNGDTESAKAIFSTMEEICEELLMLDVPDVVLPIRRKQDVARCIVEKTRSEIMNAIVMER